MTFHDAGHKLSPHPDQVFTSTSMWPPLERACDMTVNMGGLGAGSEMQPLSPGDGSGAKWSKDSPVVERRERACSRGRRASVAPTVGPAASGKSPAAEETSLSRMLRTSPGHSQNGTPVIERRGLGELSGTPAI